MSSSVWSARAARLAAAAFLAGSLGACVEATTEAVPVADGYRPMERREGVSLAPASVAIVSVDGAPAELGAVFVQDLNREARARDITLVEGSKAKYLVRGYLSAEPTADGAAFAYVWDVFSPEKLREQRLSDRIVIKGAAEDPWSLMSEPVRKTIAAKSADDLAAFLSSTPEAKPIAGALSYAPTN